MLCMLVSAMANIIQLDKYRLPEMLLVKKADFSYDDVQGEGSVIKFDLAIQPQLTKSNQTYSLTVIAADSDTSAEIISLLGNKTTRAVDTEFGVLQDDTQWIEDAQRKLLNISQNFIVYKEALMNGNDNKTVTMLNVTARIPKEGVIQTFFLFARHHNQSSPSFDSHDLLDDRDEIDELYDDLSEFISGDESGSTS